MSERVIKTGLSKKYKDMLDAVIGQMSDGYWENTPMMRGYWKFVTTGTSGNEVTLKVDTASGARDGDRHIDNRFYGMSDDAVKKFFADKIKFLVKEEVGPWERDNEATTDYLSYGEPRYRVKDCYYAYEILKGRNARKHPEYGDVAEANGGKVYTFTWWDNEPTADRRPTTSADLKNCLHKETFNAVDDAEALKLAVEYLCDYIGDDPEDVAATPKKIWDYFDWDWSSGDPIPMVLKQGRRVIKDSGFDPRKGDESRNAEGARTNEGGLEGRLEDVAQVTGALTYNDAWRLDNAAEGDKELRKKVLGLLGEFDDAAYDGDEAAMENIAKKLKELAGTKKSEARTHLGRCKNCGHGWTKTSYLDELEPAVRKYFKAKGYADNADICPKCVAAAKDYLAKNAASESGEELYNVFLDGAVWAENVSKEKANAIVNAYDGEKDCWMEKADANESFEGWDNWEEVEGLEDALEGIENLTYELRSCVRGAKTHCKDWKSLALYIKGLASNLDDAAELMAYKRDDEDESKKRKKNPSKDFSSTVEEDEDGRKLSH